MLNSKQRAFLRGKASVLEPIIQIGYKEIGENLISQIEGALDTRELIKVSFQQTFDQDIKSTINELASSIGADVVSVIGRRAVLYRKSKKNGVKHIEIL